MLPRVEIPYSEGKNLLNEGDVLLYRGNTFISRCIQRVTRGPYSHVSIASKSSDGIWEAVQFREFKGGLSISLENDLKFNKSVIDVFRPVPFFTTVLFDSTNNTTGLSRVKFDGKQVTHCMRSMTGRPYSYGRIYFLWRYYTRFWYNWQEVYDDRPLDDLIYPVCSTAVAHCFNINNYDLMKNRSDEYMSPSNLAESPRLNYLFTLILDDKV